MKAQQSYCSRRVNCVKCFKRRGVRYMQYAWEKRVLCTVLFCCENCPRFLIYTRKKVPFCECEFHRTSKQLKGALKTDTEKRLKSMPSTVSAI